MKKTNFLEVHFQSLRDFKKEVTRVLSRKSSSLQPDKQIFFDSVESYRSFMTTQKIELLAAISQFKPSSIYELAKMVDRDFAAVFRDCSGLESAGFIKLNPTKSAKGTKVPVLKFNYGGIAIFLPKSPYQIEFKSAA